ncbi:IS200/IS605 family transposase, partial [Caldibacillus thermoamylovorans]|nr:IS200/IS605 family transposase [Caldibacillus thermoamylovorans]
MKYISENHSKHLLLCHLIFVCKYRKKLLLKVGDDI